MIHDHDHVVSTVVLLPSFLIINSAVSDRINKSCSNFTMNDPGTSFHFPILCLVNNKRRKLFKVSETHNIHVPPDFDYSCTMYSGKNSASLEQMGLREDDYP